MKLSKLHLRLVWLEMSGVINTPEVVGLRLRLACYESGKWLKKWPIVSDPPPVSLIAKSINVTKERVTRLLKGNQLLPGVPMAALCRLVAVDFDWIMTGQASVDGCAPGWHIPYTRMSEDYQALRCFRDDFSVYYATYLNRSPPHVPAEAERRFVEWDTVQRDARMIAITLPFDQWLLVSFVLQVCGGRPKGADHLLAMKKLTSTVLAFPRRYAEIGEEILKKVRESAFIPPVPVTPRKRKK